MDSFLSNLLCLAKLGFRIFPCHGFDAEKQQCTCRAENCGSAGKHPRFKGWKELATTDPEQIRRWVTESNGRHNWAIATGNGVGVLDIDPRHDGEKSWGELFVECQIIEQTLEVRTGSDGRHMYFKMPAHATNVNRTGFRQGLDWRGDGGYVLIPPSLHQCGQRYEWETPIDTPLALAPECLLEELRKPRYPRPSAVSLNLLPKTDKLFDRVVSGEPDRIVKKNGIVTMVTVGGVEDLNGEGVKQGERNAARCQRVGIHIARGESLEEIEKCALAWNAKCDPPEDEEAVLATVFNLWDKECKKKEEAKAQPQATPSTENYVSPALLLGDDLFEASGAGKEGNNSGAGESVNSFLPEAQAQENEIIPSFPVSESGAFSSLVFPVSESDSRLEPNAYHGLLGEIVRAIEPETEADGAGILLSLLVAFGNAVGSKPGFEVGAEIHRTNLFLCLVGDTASGKGQAWSIAKRLMQAAGGEWYSRCIVYGLSSGEGLVERLKDEELEPEQQGKTVTSFKPTKGVRDKRLLALETEFARPITAMRREGNTLSQLIRAAWDCSTLEILTRSNQIRATGSHVSIVAHITPEELEACFSRGTEVANGFANRFLWCCVNRQRLLPHGGKISVLDPFFDQLAKAIGTAKEIGIIKLAPEASVLWEQVYPSLTESKPGAFGKAVERARPQAVRLALIYALASGTRQIEVAHLRAALAVWRYCEASAGKIFGSGAMSTREKESHPEPLAIRLHNAVIRSPGMSRSDILRDFRNCSAEDIDTALVWLKANGLVHSRMIQSERGGRPAECWYPGGSVEGSN